MGTGLYYITDSEGFFLVDSDGFYITYGQESAANIPPFDYEKTILSQYAQSPIITQLIENMSAYLDPEAKIQEFYDTVWNIETARDFGLDIWGRIVGVGRYFTIPVIGTKFFGFRGNGQPLNQYPFYPSRAATQTYRLADDAYRSLIMAKALSNICRTDVMSLNALLKMLFAGRGKCWCNNLGGMAMKYTFKFALKPYEKALIKSNVILPRPAGVEIIVVESRRSVFGFRGNGVPFGQGTFISSQDTYAI